MAINKVVYGNDTLIDLTEDSVEANNLLEGETAHDRSGSPVTGTAKQGHVVQNDSGTDMTQRGTIQFKGLNVTDDSTNGKTVVEATKTSVGLGNVPNVTTDDQIPTVTEAAERVNITAGDTLKIIIGKIKKWFTDLPSMFVSKSGDTMTGNLYVNRSDGTTSTPGTSQINLGNSVAQGTDKNSYGRLAIFGKGTNYTFLQATNSTANRTIELPDKEGTVALTSDISSRKFKENINEFTDEEAKKLLIVEMVTFDYKEGITGEDERYGNRGVIAEQVEPIIPYVVEHETIEDEEQLRIDYRKFIPYLIKMVQIQHKEIEELKAIIGGTYKTI